MNRRKILAAVLLTAVLSAAVLGGCNKEENPLETTASTEASSPSSTALETTPVTQAASESKNQTETEANAEVVYVPDDGGSVKDKPDEPCTVNVDGKAYTAYVGDTINYVFNLKTPEALEDFQATTNYDSGMLELIETDATEMFPIAGSVVVCNTEMQNCIKFNAVNLSGMDFTQGGILVSFKFRVLDSGGTAISTTLEYMDSIKSEPYVSDYKIVGDIEYSEEIK